MQSINLYLPEFRPKREWLSATSIAISGAGFICLLTIIGWVASDQTQSYRKVVLDLELQLKTKQSNLIKIKSMAKGIDVKAADKKIEQLENAIENRKRIKAVLSKQSLGNDVGFSSMVKSIATNSSKEFSLQSFSVLDGGSVFNASGETLAPASIPKYIEALAESKAFSQTNFGLLQINSIEKKSKHTFRMGSTIQKNSIVRAN